MAARPHSRARRIQARFTKARRELPLLLGREQSADLRRFRHISPTDGAASTGYHVLLAAPGNGNIGDQALFEAFLEATTGDVRVVVRDETDVIVPDDMVDRVTLVPLSHLIYGSGPTHDAHVDAFVTLLAGASSVSVVGADIMDGRYSLRASVRRLTLAHGARSLGIDTRILGFSWHSHPRLAAKRALVKASRAGLVPMLRDPVSAERARADGVEGVIETTDIVFAATSLLPHGIAVEAPYAVINASALIGRRLDQTRELAEVARHLRSLGLAVVVLPHVSVASSDDIAVCRAVAAALPDGEVTLVDRMLRPGQVRDLAGGAEVVVTGRMHLAVMALTRGVPAVTLSTAGKVEGLMRLLGVPQLCIDPKAGFGAQVIEVVDSVLPRDSAARAEIAANMPSVVEVALRNTEGLRASAESSL